MCLILDADRKQQDIEAHTEGENRKSVTSQLATYLSQNRQQLSRICEQSQARLLLDRLEGLGGGTGEAARRRGRTAWLERKWELERHA